MSFSISSKIAVTGAAGYIGTTLVKTALTPCFHNVVAIDVDLVPLTPFAVVPNFFPLKKDILSLTEKDLKGCEVIFHLASVVGTPACEKDPEEAKRVNRDGTKHLIEIAKGIPIIFTNTNIGYPKGESDETALLTPTGIYSETKIEAEEMILKAHGTSVRLASVCGVSPKMRDDLLLNFLVKEAVFKDEMTVFDAHSYRNFVHVQDVASLLLNNYQKIGRGQAYNLAYPNHATKIDLLKIIEKKLKKQLKLKFDDKQDPDKRDYHLSMRKWTERTHTYPKTTIQEAIEELITYYEFKKLSL